MRMGIPEEVMIDLLLRLPIKTLFRFKCVCKRWYILIESPYFVRCHLQKTGGIMQPQCHLIHSSKNEISLPSLSAGLMSGSSDQILELEDAPGLHFDGNDVLGIHGRFMSYVQTQAQDASFSSSIWGPVNGVYLIKSKGKITGACTLLLWNPGSREVHVPPPIPPAILPSPLAQSLRKNQGKYLVCSFGYDSLTDDFKILVITVHGDRLADFLHFYCFHLYSLASNEWRQLDPFEIFSCHPDYVEVRPHGGVALRNCLYEEQTGCCFDGAYHWLQNWSPEPAHVLSFDFEIEEFLLTTIPIEFTTERGQLRLALVDGCLALVCSPSETNPLADQASNSFDVFVMRDNGIEEMWTPAFRITIPCLGWFIGIVDGEFFFQPLASSLRVLSCRRGALEPERNDYCCLGTDSNKKFTVFPYRGSLFPARPRKVFS